ncbi:MAG: DUF6046 domain-containing protein [Tannerellaceae bacterium]|nr:DUF6046 domain-containing protein [Tannerellaceae bacterium]
MATYDLNKLIPSVNAGYNGNPFGPGKITINKALGSIGAIPPYFIPKKEDIITRVNDPGEIIRGYEATKVLYSVMPISLKREEDKEWFTLPLEPLVSVRGRNIIVRRSVAKSSHKGSVKERWSQDDFEITIQGVVSINEEEEYPERYVNSLLTLFNERQPIEVDQQILLLLGIKYLVIESVTFPHTKGLQNQNFELKAYSDYPINLLVSL